MRLALVAPLFLLSGGTALLYQVAFGKKLATIFGATAYAVSAVLAAFMGGLALGSWLGGRYGARLRRPIVAYGVAELAVAVVCALTPWFFDALAAGYVAAVGALPGSLAIVSAVRALLTSLVVIVPTIAMGVTLPVLARAMAAQHEGDKELPRRRLALLYAINTAGGALGALACAYVVLPELGVAWTMRAAALVNVAIGGLAIVIGRKTELAPLEQEARDERESDQPEHSDAVLVAIAFASGLLVFATEVVDTHLLALLIGNSAYAFGLMLAAFLTCLSLGAALAQPVDRRLGPRALPASLLCTGAALVATIPLWGEVPNIFVAAAEHVTTWSGREWLRASIAFALLALPTTLMGLTFPLLLRRVAGRSDVARRVGRLTAMNTIGSIAGSIVAGYLMLPVLGSENMLRAIGLCFAACAALAAGLELNRKMRGALLASPGLVLLLAIVVPRWDMGVLTNGANVYFESRDPPDEMRMVREDVHGGFTSVTRTEGISILYTNGKFQGDDGDQMVAQRSFAHYPSLFVDKFDRALVIGLGTGTTLGTLTAYPYERIDVAEISPAIVEAARRFFTVPNRNGLDDPRVHMFVEDGRNMLLFAREPYDLITIELSSVWFAGAANLYSREFYELCRDRLGSSGVLQQWVQMHHIYPREIAVALRTMRSVFPHVALFGAGGQGIVVASMRPLVASRAQLRELSARPDVIATLDHATTLEDLLKQLMVSGPDLDRFLDDTARRYGEPLLSTDDNVYLEYATPKGNTLPYFISLVEIAKMLQRYRARDALERHIGP